MAIAVPLHPAMERLGKNALSDLRLGDPSGRSPIAASGCLVAIVTAENGKNEKSNRLNARTFSTAFGNPSKPEEMPPRLKVVDCSAQTEYRAESGRRLLVSGTAQRTTRKKVGNNSRGSPLERHGFHMSLSNRDSHNRLWILAWSVLLLSGGSVKADRYYLLIFGSQTHPKIPRYTHTFCTLVRVGDPLPSGAELPLEVHTISWLPLTLQVKPYRLHPEPGYNLTLEETLNWCAKNKMRVALWGPYAITERFYGRVYREYARFESGEFLYRAIDGTRRGDIATDCIHAVTDIDRQDSRLRYPVFRSGDAVTRKFVRILRDQGNLKLPAEDVSWLDAALGLDRFGVSHRPNP